MKCENWVLEYDWEKNITNTSAPRMHQTALRTMGLYSSIIQDLTVQADPDDYLKIKENTGLKIFHAHAMVWRNTLDLYLYYVFCLKELGCSKEESIEWVELSFPEKMTEKILNHLEKERHNKARELLVDTAYVKLVSIKKSVKTGGTCFSTPKIGHALYLDYLFRSLYTPPQAMKKVLSLQYDGLRFQKEGMAGVLPEFALEDYYLHEISSGISLTIEISAIRLEVMRKHHDEQLWDEAFSVFCRKMLPTIVRSPFFFTRNAVARYFFQQILSDLTLQSYQWKDTSGRDSRSDLHWDQLIEHAVSHLAVLEEKVDPIDVSIEQADKACEHFVGLLSKVTAPVDIMDYIRKPSHGLALFCNPKHKYVPVFLEELERQNVGKSEKKRKIDRYRGKEDNPFVLFMAVRKEVKEAIAFHKTLQNANEYDNIEAVFLKNSFPHCVWETYSAFANTEGGIIVLIRPIPEKYNKFLYPGIEYEAAWEVSAEEVIKSFLSHLNNSQNVSANILSTEDIHVREYNGQEFIVVTVSERKKGDDLIYINDSSSMKAYCRKQRNNIPFDERDNT